MARTAEKRLAVHERLHLLIHASGLQSLVLCLAVVVSSLDVCAQSAENGALKGTVTDPSGAVVPNATIALRNHGTEETRTAITDPQGLYRFSRLPPGECALTVEAPGFAPLVVRKLMNQIDNE